MNAVLASRGFHSFYKGVNCFLSDRGDITVRAVNSSRSVRGTGYRLVKHSIYTRVETSSGHVGHGYGESDIELLAIQKSIAEAVERSVFLEVGASDPLLNSSNGWAAHTSLPKAQAAARNELLERDAILLHWLSETPLWRIDQATLPSHLIRWLKSELAQAPRYNLGEVFISYLGEVPTVSALVYDENGYGFISHAAGKSLLSASTSALAEAVRLADLTTKKIIGINELSEINGPEDHAQYYAQKATFPKWFFRGATMPMRTIEQLWKEHQVRESSLKEMNFDNYRCGSLHISRCRSGQVQDLFFGETEKALETGRINFGRIKQKSGVETVNLFPHFIA